MTHLLAHFSGEPSAVVGLFDDDATAIKELKTNLLDAVTSGSVSVVQLALNNEVISEDIAFTSSVLALYNDYASIVEVIRTKTGIQLTHSLTHSLSHSLTHSLTHSFTYSLTLSLTHSLTHS